MLVLVLIANLKPEVQRVRALCSRFNLTHLHRSVSQSKKRTNLTTSNHPSLSPNNNKRPLNNNSTNNKPHPAPPQAHAHDLQKPKLRRAKVWVARRASNSN